MKILIHRSVYGLVDEVFYVMEACPAKLGGKRAKSSDLLYKFYRYSICFNFQRESFNDII